MASKAVEKRPGAYTRSDEKELTFAGFLLFFDPPKADVQQAIVDLAKRGVQLKIITGDNQKVARHIAEAVNLPVMGLLTGSDLTELRDEALWHLAERTTLCLGTGVQATSFPRPRLLYLVSGPAGQLGFPWQSALPTAGLPPTRLRHIARAI